MIILYLFNYFIILFIKLNIFYYFNNKELLIILMKMGIGDWGLGIGPNPQ